MSFRDKKRMGSSGSGSRAERLERKPSTSRATDDAECRLRLSARVALLKSSEELLNVVTGPVLPGNLQRELGQNVGGLLGSAFQEGVSTLGFFRARIGP